MTEDPTKPRRRRLALIYWSICLIILIAVALFWLFFLRVIAFTTDAYVQGNQVYITPLVSGFITAIHTDDTFFVKKGQLLIELDATDARIQSHSTKKKLSQVVREVCQLFHQVFVYQAELKVRQAELIRSIQDYQHRYGVLDVEGVSLEDFEHAVAAYRESYHSLEMTYKLYSKAFALVQGTTIRNHPLVQASAADYANAWVQEYRTNVYAPVDGIIAQRTIQVGMWIPSGNPLMSVIPLDQIWVNANYKETQLRRMRIGQKVTMRSDLYGSDVLYHGIIVGLPGAAGNVFSLLPPQNLSGNWIKIVQRLPVRVELDPEELKDHPLRIGLSMEAVVDLEDQSGLLVPNNNYGPTYHTSIFEEEEKGLQKAIDQIIYKNLDPALVNYLDEHLTSHVTFESLISDLGNPCIP